MTELKCPKCGETEEIYDTFNFNGKCGIQCGNCGYEVKDCESEDEAEFKWRSENDPKALRPCLFCGCTQIMTWHIGHYDKPWVAECARCLADGPHADTEEEAIEKWNRRANE